MIIITIINTNTNNNNNSNNIYTHIYEYAIIYTYYVVSPLFSRGNMFIFHGDEDPGMGRKGRRAEAFFSSWEPARSAGVVMHPQPTTTI